MAEELRLYFSADYIDFLAQELSSEIKLSNADFRAYCLQDPWDDMALKERMARLTDAIVRFLPEDANEGIAILKRILPRISGDAFKFAGMLNMFIPDYVVQHKENLTLDAALEALIFFTHNGTTSEFAIRPFIIEHPEKSMATLQELAFHPHPHVRRFASEGCRPRLPWAMALPKFKKDPAPILPILEALRADDSVFVQKSVANNLNDIAKDNPEIVLDYAGQWLGSHANTNWIIKHGSRTLLKKGNPRALALFGATPVELTQINLELSHSHLDFGETLSFNFDARILGKLPDNLRIEYAIDFMKSNGKQARKIFKISEIKPTMSDISLKKSHKFIDYSTRKHYGGAHGVALIVNGVCAAHKEFELMR
ncbi:MAG: DNA alkylation repair protein [Sneathiella sp.]|nr:DNA alkylation repair protein [Sneathiella sp.]